MHPLSRYKPIADAVTLIFGAHTEAVIHDIKTDTVFYISNGFSGRQAGDDAFLRMDSGTDHFGQDVIGPYEKAGERGTQLNSITAVLRDDNGSAEGLLCINVDNSKHREALSVLGQLIAPPNLDKQPEVLFRNDWQSQIQAEINTFLSGQGYNIESIPPHSRKQLIALLEDKGLFYAKKAMEQLSTMLGVSRATLYKDLAAIRKNDPKQVLS